MAWTKQQIDRMSGEEYKTHMSDPEFLAAVNAEPEQPGERAAIPTGTATARGRAQLAERKQADPAFANDPSFADEVQPAESEVTFGAPVVAATAVPAVADAVAPVPVIAPVPATEYVREYQPTDEQGRPRGGKQVFKGSTVDEVLDKVVAAHKAASEEIHRLREKQIMESTELPENSAPARDLGERVVMTADERKAWEEKLQDPATSAQAQYQLDRDDDHQFSNDLLRKNYETSILLALETFRSRNRDYVATNENATKLVGFIDRRGLDPTDARSYQKAYDILRENGVVTTSLNQPAVPALATEAPSVREEKTVPNSQAPVAAPARISPEVPPQATRPVAPIPTGLSNNDSSTDGEPSEQSIEDQLTYRRIFKDGAGKPTGVTETYKGIAALRNMPATEYKRLIEEDVRKERQTGTGTGFRKTVDSLEALDQKRQQESRRRR